ncbi:hypothetical protein B0H12DRAFT_1067278 [Mycena haematopus]|nr:hypothetical protein B0H12DRAFT_1067278 [Mycena haematopus]
MNLEYKCRTSLGSQRWSVAAERDILTGNTSPRRGSYTAKEHGPLGTALLLALERTPSHVWAAHGHLPCWRRGELDNVGRTASEAEPGSLGLGYRGWLRMRKGTQTKTRGRRMLVQPACRRPRKVQLVAVFAENIAGGASTVSGAGAKIIWVLPPPRSSTASFAAIHVNALNHDAHILPSLTTNGHSSLIIPRTPPRYRAPPSRATSVAPPSHVPPRRAPFSLGGTTHIASSSKLASEAAAAEGRGEAGEAHEHRYVNERAGGVYVKHECVLVDRGGETERGGAVCSRGSGSASEDVG